MSSSAIEAAAMVASLEETASVPARSTYFDDDDMDEYEEDQLALELDCKCHSASLMFRAVMLASV